MKLELAAQRFAVMASESDEPGPARTISGLAVPWDTAAVASTGPVKFLTGSLPVDGPAPKLLRDHDLAQPIGLVTARVDTAEGILFDARVSATAAGDEVLTLAADGVLDAVSVGVDIIEHHYTDGVMVVTSALWRELSVVPFGAFDTARIAKVAATENQPEPDKPTEGTSLMTTPILFQAARPQNASSYLADFFAGRDVQAANGDTGDIPGILPEPIVGPLYDGLSATRRLVAAIGTSAMPDRGKIFTIPKVTTRPTVAIQTDEHDALSSTAMVVGDVSVTKATYGGYVNLSEQSVDWSDPTALGLLIEQLGKAYALATETASCDALVAGATDTETIADWADASEVMTAIYTAATTIAGATGEMPSDLYVSPDRFANLATLQSSAGDFLFPSLSPAGIFGSLAANSLVGSPAGLRLVVSPKFAAGTFIVGSGGMRLFEQQKGSITAANPSTMGLTVAWRGYFASAFLDAARYVSLIDV